MTHFGAIRASSCGRNTFVFLFMQVKIYTYMYCHADVIYAKMMRGM